MTEGLLDDRRGDCPRYTCGRRRPRSDGRADRLDGDAHARAGDRPAAARQDPQERRSRPAPDRCRCGRPDGRHDRRGRGLRGRRIPGPVHRLPTDRGRPEGGSTSGAGVAMRPLGRGGFDHGCRNAGGRLEGCHHLRAHPHRDRQWWGTDQHAEPNSRDRSLDMPATAGSRWSARSPTRAMATGGRNSARRPARTQSRAWMGPLRRSAPRGLEPLGHERGGDTDIRAVGAWHRDRGAPRDVCLWRSPAGRAPG